MTTPVEYLERNLDEDTQVTHEKQSAMHNVTTQWTAGGRRAGLTVQPLFGLKDDSCHNSRRCLCYSDKYYIPRDAMHWWQGKTTLKKVHP